MSSRVLCRQLTRTHGSSSRKIKNVVRSECRRRYTDSSASTSFVLCEKSKPGVALITLNRPKAYNALNTELMKSLNSTLRRYESDDSIRAIVLTGGEKAFAAGADITEMKDKSFSDAYKEDFLESWSFVTTKTKKPIISAINGYCLGGGFELAMMTDIMYCSRSAVFGQPEIKLGVIPGAGGSQRLTRLVGKHRAMELILTGRTFSATEAEKMGVVCTEVLETPAECIAKAVDTATQIAQWSRVAVKAAKEAVNKSQDLGLRDGVEYERKVFHSLFGTEDQKIGMEAFVSKVKEPIVWKHK